MFDIGWQELFILAVLAIIVIGPKDLPGAIRIITKWIRKARSMARDFQDGLDEVVREADLDDLKKELDSPGGLDIAKKIGEAVDPTGEIAKDMDLDKDLYDEMSGAVDDLKKITDPDSGPRDSKDADPKDSDPKDSENAPKDAAKDSENAPKDAAKESENAPKDAAKESENAPRDAPNDSENAAKDARKDDDPAEGEAQKTSRKASG